MKLIVGLGNPGREYRWTRHNMGFLLFDELARENRIALARRGLKAVYGRGRIARNEVILAKPQTFMNLSGEAVQRLLHFFKIPPRGLGCSSRRSGPALGKDPHPARRILRRPPGDVNPFRSHRKR